MTITLGVPNDAEHLAIEETIMKMRIGEEDHIELRKGECSGEGTTSEVVTLELKDFSGPQVSWLSTGFIIFTMVYLFI